MIVANLSLGNLLLLSLGNPSGDYIKLNADGSTRGNPGRNGGEGVLRDYMGQWKAGFVIGIASAYAEIQALVHGLQLAWDLGCRSIVVELDSEVIVG
ncbi:hypothetical protein GH714_033914 [Hevea brasiliensis]|uniref:RNase H type-1 domain-containing protein n=1 Tax=Hevea brasiliensis TaxID=3981 RepID=A0A6A6KDL5_HEVBR|nr:hypothetical protein GH714_033914 [Hevea brasiliensis]